MCPKSRVLLTLGRKNNFPRSLYFFNCTLKNRNLHENSQSPDHRWHLRDFSRFLLLRAKSRSDANFVTAGSLDTNSSVAIENRDCSAQFAGKRNHYVIYDWLA